MGARMKLRPYLPHVGHLVRHLCRVVTVMALVLAALALLGALTGCGGGDPEDNPLPPDAPPAQTDAPPAQTDGRKGNHPPECHLRPELCS
jgi:hypothetical protein